MVKEINIVVSPIEAAQMQRLKTVVSQNLSVSDTSIQHIQIIRKSIDARNRNIRINLMLRVFINEPFTQPVTNNIEYKNVATASPIIIVGAGPAGLFAALRLIELGLKPIVLERGKEIFERKKDVALISRESIVNTDSNYCFGEGGAGTFSDGKLYTRSNKRGNIQRILQIFNAHGAPANILYEAHPHIGTDLLPQVIKNMRLAIINAGGQVHFNSRVISLIIKNNIVEGVNLANGSGIMARAVILATGHSAHDVYEMLYANNIALEAKPFAMGVRVEHPQELIDQIQYHGFNRGTVLEAASYSLVQQVNGRGVFSFCMCPGGFIVPSATQQNQVVVNGMSPNKRNSPFANSGIVTEIRESDTQAYSQFGPLAGLHFQQNFEKLAWLNGNKTQQAPAQCLSDFVNGISSTNLPKVSYFPGVVSSNMHQWLPPFICSSLQSAFKLFNNKMHGFLTNQAVIVGVESRTSSPVRIPRNTDTLEHIQIKGLYPCGEGSGYAGGITSSAMDGEKAAEMVALALG